MPSPLQLQRPTAANADAATTTVNICPRHKHLQPHVRRVCLTRGMDVPDSVERCHTHAVGPSQCCSVVVQHCDTSPNTVWSILRQFDNPQSYKRFVRTCHVVSGDGCHVGSIREIHVVSGLPAEFSVERLEVLDEDQRVVSFSVVGGDHRLKNYRSVTTVHQSSDGKGAVVVESYVVDVPAGNTKEETRCFADTIVRCNLQSLAQLAENTAKNS